MALRAFAVAAAALPAVVALLSSDLTEHRWIVSVAATVMGTGLLVARPRSWALVLLGLAMTLLGVQLGQQARNLLDVTATLQPAEDQDEGDGWPVYDLRRGPVPPSTPEHIAVRGFLRDEWVLDEYRVAAGERPDQSKPPEAVLVPMAPEAEAPITIDGPIVVARVRPQRLEQGGLQTVRGRTDPLPTRLLATLLEVAGGLDPSVDVTGIVIDTIDVATPQQAWIKVWLSVLIATIGGVCYWIASATPPPRRT